MINGKNKMKNEAVTLEVNEENVGARADIFMCEKLGITRSAAQKLLEGGAATLRGETVPKNYKMRRGDAPEVVIPEPKEPDAEPEDIPLDVVYEDSDITVVNKPAGMVIRPAPGHERGTLV